MIRIFEDLGPATLTEVDEVIDVRSPAEFDQDHAPEAINLPVLSEEERAEVGTLYVQHDPFRARRLGAAMVARNIARHLEGPLRGRGPAWRPLVYCWRGGQRSHALATVLSQVGWRTALLQGGYKTYRRSVVQALYHAAPPAPLVLLAGRTGVGKTELLARLRTRGVQVIDLEDLAGHRGSLLGALPGQPQPSQRLFETRLAATLAALDPERPVLVEAEGSRIGALAVPTALWSAMRQAPIIELEASLEARTDRLVASYAATPDQQAVIGQVLGRLPRHIGRTEVDRWRGLLGQGAWTTLARELAERHYDPAYGRSLNALGGPRLGRVVVRGPDSGEAAVQAILALLAALPGR